MLNIGHKLREKTFSKKELQKGACVSSTMAQLVYIPPSRAWIPCRFGLAHLQPLWPFGEAEDEKIF